MGCRQRQWSFVYKIGCRAWPHSRRKRMVLVEFSISRKIILARFEQESWFMKKMLAFILSVFMIAGNLTAIANAETLDDVEENAMAESEEVVDVESDESVGILKLSGYLDGADAGSIAGYGIVDIYINNEYQGSFSDYSAEWPIGSSYEIKGVRPLEGKEFTGYYSGSAAGVISDGENNVSLSFNTVDATSYGKQAKMQGNRNHAYLLFDKPSTWYAANIVAQQFGGHLVTVTSEEEAGFLEEFAEVPCWLGASNATDGKTWEWVNGDAFSFNNWALGEPDDSVDNDERGEHYLANYEEGWKSSAGCTMLPFVVELDGYGVIDINGFIDGEKSDSFVDYGTMDVYINGEYQGTFSDYWKAWPDGTEYEIKNIRPAEGKEYLGCYEGSVAGQLNATTGTKVFLSFDTVNVASYGKYSKMQGNRGNVYLLFDKPSTWYAANIVAQQHGGHLVSVTSEAEAAYLERFVGGSYWLGASNAVDGESWEWVNGDVFSFDNWALGEPYDSVDNDERSEHYLASYEEGWKSSAGYTLLPFVVELDGYGVIDINGWLDNEKNSSIAGYGTMDVYINGEYQGTFSDYCRALPNGTEYEIKNIRPAEGKEYLGCYTGSVAGQVNANTGTNVFLSFGTVDAAGYGREDKMQARRDHVYLLFDMPSTWYAAKQVCEQRGGHLVTVTNEEEAAFLATFVGSNFWLGASNVEDGETWEWINGEEFSYNRWAQDEPSYSTDNDERSEHYLESGTGEGWNSAPGYMLHPFVCELDDYGIIDINGLLDGERNSSIEGYGTMDVYINDEYKGTFSDYFRAWPIGTTYEIKNIRPAEGKEFTGCKQESVVGQIKSTDTNVFLGFNTIQAVDFSSAGKKGMHNGQAYMLFETPSTWYAAKETCERLGGHLATVTSLNEDAFLNDFVGRNYWLGASNVADGKTWEWINGEELSYSRWASEEPNNSMDNDERGEHYLESGGEAGWNSAAGYMLYPFVCEFDDATIASIAAQPQDQYVNNGEKAIVTLKATGDDLKYQWYLKNKTAKKFSKSSIVKDTYSVTMSDAVDGRQLYCEVTDRYGNTVASDIVTLNKYIPLTIVKQPVDSSVEIGEKAITKVEATGNGLTYQWYIKNRTATKFSKSSIVKDTYSVTMSDAVDGRQLYCVVTDIKGNSVGSDIVTLHKVVSLSIVQQPRDAYAIMGAKVSTTVVAEGDGLTYQWYIKNTSATKFSKSSVTKATYSTTMSSKVNGRKAYCVVVDRYGHSVVTDIVTLHEGTPLSIVEQPKDAYAAMGTKVSTRVVAEGEDLTYQWYIKNANATKFSKSSVTKATYSTIMSNTVNGRQIYCVVSDGYGNTVTSSTVTFSMADPVVITRQPQNASAPIGNYVEVSCEANGEGLAYQ